MSRAVPIAGKNAKVTIGADKILGIGNYKYTAAQADDLDTTEFEDLFEMTEAGIKKGGQITFEGVGAIGDDTGQERLKAAWANDEAITDIRFYFNATSYYAPTPVTGVRIKTFSLDVDKTGLGKISFTGKVDERFVHNPDRYGWCGSGGYCGDGSYCATPDWM